METVRRGYEPKDVVEFGPGAAEKMNAARAVRCRVESRWWSPTKVQADLVSYPRLIRNTISRAADYVHPGRVGGTGAETDDSGAGVPCSGRL